MEFLAVVSVRWRRPRQRISFPFSPANERPWIMIFSSYLTTTTTTSSAWHYQSINSSVYLAYGNNSMNSLLLDELQWSYQWYENSIERANAAGLSHWFFEPYSICSSDTEHWLYGASRKREEATMTKKNRISVLNDGTINFHRLVSFSFSACSLPFSCWCRTRDAERERERKRLWLDLPHCLSLVRTHA